MSLQGYIARDKVCPKCNECLVLTGYPGAYHWWCQKCHKEYK